MAVDSQTILICGAGPTGLALGCSLVRSGARFRIIEKDRALSTFSKALAVHAHTLELLDGFGLAEKLISRGRKMHCANIHLGKDRIASLDFSKIPSRYNFVLSLPQSETEELLAAELKGAGIRIESGTELVLAEPERDAVRVRLSTGEELRAPWLVGCDGGDSTVREEMNVTVAKTSTPFVFALADLELDWPETADSLELFFGASGPFAIIPLPRERTVRAIMLVSREGAHVSPPTSGEWETRFYEAFGRDPRIRAKLWDSVFRIGTALSARFIKGRMILAGDAAHLHSPIGGQGMNLGIHDAVFLGRAFQRILSGASPRRELRRYNNVRRKSAAGVVAGTALSTRAVASSNTLITVMRRYFLTHLHPAFEAALVKQIGMVRERGNY